MYRDIESDEAALRHHHFDVFDTRTELAVLVSGFGDRLIERQIWEINLAW